MRNLLDLIMRNTKSHPNVVQDQILLSNIIPKIIN